MSEDDFWNLGALCEDPRFSRAAVEKLREKAAAAPLPPDMKQRLLFSSYKLPAPPPYRRPQWVSEVCAQRVHFQSNAFRVRLRDGGRPSFYAFLYAYQNPLFIVVARLRPFCPDIMIDGLANGLAAEDWDWGFVVTSAYVGSTKGMQDWPEERVGVIPQVCALWGEAARCLMRPRSLCVLFCMNCRRWRGTPLRHQPLRPHRRRTLGLIWSRTILGC